MTGAFNQDRSRNQFGNRWVHVPKPKHGGRGKFVKWKNQMCVVLSIGKSSARLYLMEPVIKALGNPKYVGVMTAGSNVGLYAEDSSDEYLVTYKSSEEVSATPSISVSFMAKMNNWKQGAYDCHVEAGGLVVFNPAGPFSEL